MLNQRKINKWFVLAYIILIMSPVDANVTNEELNESEINISRFGYSVPVPSVGPPDMNYTRNRPEFITFVGTLPTIQEDSEKYEWTYSVIRSTCNLSFDLGSYMHTSGGPVVMTGAGWGGYIMVELDSNQQENITESVIDEIYQIVNTHCEVYESITDVPTLFLWDDPPEKDIEITNESLFIGNEKVEPEQTSGFTSALLFLCLVLLVKTRTS
ncbi:hypothetical protein MettiDRAFT_1505 [Methanolobus tindarius DSM 2278]|uniref:Uncharacterized protein n=1 Tax=Methanolobus tindarius DSM 2278 TaxID=1090322 RepID=W9DR25_METTI|nr:hypothetical protein [Methanolobus tindarius]ETA68058.1 hypothetical protein MettiDRAFT_1505 [Methanolobus tindarius DSM 2278]